MKNNQGEPIQGVETKSFLSQMSCFHCSLVGTKLLKFMKESGTNMIISKECVE